MPDFRLYDPSQSLGAAPPKACQKCHVRKVRCIPSREGGSCQQCLKRGVDCQSRSRKRKRPLQNQGNQPSPRNIRSEPTQAMDHPFAVNGEQLWLSEQHSQSAPPLLFTGRSARNTTHTSPVTPSTVDRFHNSSFLCRTAILDQDFQDIDHSNGGAAAADDEFKLSSTDLETLHLHKAFDLPGYPERQSLLEVFFDKCWTFTPVVDRTALEQTEDDVPVCHLVIQAVLLAGCIMRLHRYSASQRQVLHNRVKASIYSGYERNPLQLLAALCLMQWSTSAAPKDITQDSPRYWTTMAIGIAQQMGLHRQSQAPKADESLRRRIWWMLCARDNLSASAHGRPRLINLLDCTQPPLIIEDFPESRNDTETRIFISYVSVLQVLGDLCSSIVRRGEVEPSEKADIATRLTAFMGELPEDLRLVDATGCPTPYNLHVAQLHIPILAIILILYRPKSVFSLSSANAASIAAANLSFRIFEAIELREHTHCLSSAFSWHLLMRCIPLLSCLRISQLKDAASSSLEILEKVLSTLGHTRPSATKNLRSVKANRKAMTSSLGSSRGNATSGEGHDSHGYLSMAPALLSAYGSGAVLHYEKVVTQLGEDPITEPSNTTEQNQDTYAPSQHQQEFLDPLGLGGSCDDQFNFDELFGSGHSWMMRDWMIEF